MLNWFPYPTTLLRSGCPCATMVTRIYKSGDGGAVGTVGNAITSLRSKSVSTLNRASCALAEHGPQEKNGQRKRTSERLNELAE